MCAGRARPLCALSRPRTRLASAAAAAEETSTKLEDIYDAEKQLTKALPKLAKKASNEELRDALEQHLQQTEGHVERLEQIFERLGMKAKGKRCEGMKHLNDEGSDMIGDADEEGTRDAVMIAAAQKTEHYEIASYGTLRTGPTWSASPRSRSAGAPLPTRAAHRGGCRRARALASDRGN